MSSRKFNDPQNISSLLTVVIPTRGRRSPDGEYLIDSLLDCAVMKEFENLNGRILIVSHESEISEDKIASLVSEHRGVEFVEFKGASTFPAKCNAAFRSVKSKYFVCINDDVTQITDGFFDDVCRTFERNASLGIIAPRLIFPDGRIQHEGVDLESGLPRLRGYGRMNRMNVRQLDPSGEIVLAVSGALMAIRKDCFLSLDGFDDRLRNSFNDIDLCLRAGVAGWKVFVDLENTAVHGEFGTRKLRENRLRDLVFFGRRWAPFLLKHQRGPQFDFSMERFLIRAFLRVAAASRHFRRPQSPNLRREI